MTSAAGRGRAADAAQQCVRGGSGTEGVGLHDGRPAGPQCPARDCPRGARRRSLSGTLLSHLHPTLFSRGDVTLETAMPCDILCSNLSLLIEYFARAWPGATSRAATAAATGTRSGTAAAICDRVPAAALGAAALRRLRVRARQQQPLWRPECFPACALHRHQWLWPHQPGLFECPQNGDGGGEGFEIIVEMLLMAHMRILDHLCRILCRTILPCTSCITQHVEETWQVMASPYSGYTQQHPEQPPLGHTLQSQDSFEQNAFGSQPSGSISHYGSGAGSSNLSLSIPTAQTAEGVTALAQDRCPAPGTPCRAARLPCTAQASRRPAASTLSGYPLRATGHLCDAPSAASLHPINHHPYM